MKNFDLSIGYFLTGIIFLLSLLFPSVSYFRIDGATIFIAEVAAIILTAVLLVEKRFSNPSFLKNNRSKLNVSGVLLSLLFIVAWSGSIFIFSFGAITAFIYFVYSALNKIIAIHRIGSEVDWNFQGITYLINLASIAFSTIFVAVLISPIYCPGAQCTTANTIWGVLYFFLTGTLILIAGILMKKYQKNFLPKL